MRRILVTGAAGQIGSELVPAPRERYGAESVVASDVRVPPATAAREGPFEHLDCVHIRELDGVVARRDVGTIYHLAALLSQSWITSRRKELPWSL